MVKIRMFTKFYCRRPKHIVRVYYAVFVPLKVSGYSSNWKVWKTLEFIVKSSI